MRTKAIHYHSVLSLLSLSVIYCIVHSAAYNPWISVVGMRTTRSLLTAPERSTAIGITTGMIGTTGRRGEGKGKLAS